MEAEPGSPPIPQQGQQGGGGDRLHGSRGSLPPHLAAQEGDKAFFISSMTAQEWAGLVLAHKHQPNPAKVLGMQVESLGINSQCKPVHKTA